MYCQDRFRDDMLCQAHPKAAPVRMIQGIVYLPGAIVSSQRDQTNFMPFTWTTDPDAILEKVRCETQVLELIDERARRRPTNDRLNIRSLGTPAENLAGETPICDQHRRISQTSPAARQGTFRPLTASAAEITSRTEWPRPVPRLSAKLSPPARRYSSAFR